MRARVVLLSSSRQLNSSTSGLGSSPRQPRSARSSPPVAWCRSAPPSRPPPVPRTLQTPQSSSCPRRSLLRLPASDSGRRPRHPYSPSCPLQLVRHLAVRRRVQTEDFLLLRHAQANGDVDDLEDDPGHASRER